MILPDGGRIWVSQNARAVRDADGALLHFECTLEDITERKRSADAVLALNASLERALGELKAAQQQVIRQERLRALGEMASGIAHDFNNALTPIQGFAELLLVRPDIFNDEKTARRYLQTILTGAKDAANVVARLREFYRSNEQRDVFAAVDLRRIVEQSIALTQPKWKDQAQASGAQIRIATEFADVPPASGDESALREVLTNLLFNAVDAMPRGGTITLRTRLDGARAVIEVADTGTGMTDAVRERCLEPFFSTKGARGTGLGLAMVFGIVQRHGGSLDIESKPGEGTKFIVRLPLHATDNVTPEVSGPEPPQSALRVLLVEDEPEVREVIAAFLSNEGHAVETAADGNEALGIFKKERFDLVVTDKAMPGMNGDQLAMQLKKLAPQVAVILLTGFGHFLEAGSIPGVDVLAAKPITLPALRAAIGKAIQPA
jgi:signal transduction histidine kinase/CheY-like chemotaxis protein